MPRPFVLPLDGRETGGLIATIGSALSEGRRAYCLDGGNVFNPLVLSQWLRQGGVDPLPILGERLFVSRAFTCHQLAGAIQTMLAPLAWESSPPPVLILGVDHLFLDEDIPLFERRFLFEKIIAEAELLAGQGLPLLFTCGAGPDNPWARRLRQSASLLSNAAQAAQNMGGLIHGPHLADLQHLA